MAGSPAGPPEADAGFAITHGLYWLALRLAEREPLLVVVDDAHWADDPSLRWLIYLSGRDLGRADRGARGGSLRRARLGRSGRRPGSRSGGARASLRPLGTAAVSELVRRRLAGCGGGLLPALLRAHCGQPTAPARAVGGARGQRPQPDETDLAAGATAAARERWSARCCAGSPRWPRRHGRWRRRSRCSRTMCRSISPPRSAALEPAVARGPRERAGARRRPAARRSAGLRPSAAARRRVRRAAGARAPCETHGRAAQLLDRGRCSPTSRCAPPARGLTDG